MDQAPHVDKGLHYQDSNNLNPRRILKQPLHVEPSEGSSKPRKALSTAWKESILPKTSNPYTNNQNPKPILTKIGNFTHQSLMVTAKPP